MSRHERANEESASSADSPKKTDAIPEDTQCLGPETHPSKPKEIVRNTDQDSSERREIDKTEKHEKEERASDLDPDKTEQQSGSHRILPAKKSEPVFNAPGYELLERVGDGTFGIVWRARALDTGYQVAIKFLTSRCGLSWQLMQFEVRQLAQFHEDPGIVQIVDIQPDASPPFFVMKFAENGSLAKRLSGGAMPFSEATELFAQIVKAMAYVHEKGVLHCDLKPGNILLDARNRAMVADFGQSHLSSEASPALGTFFYMAPEQAVPKAQFPDTRWDVYGLGAVFYHMLTGAPPRDHPEIRKELRGTSKTLNERLDFYRNWVSQAPKPTEHRRVPGMDRSLSNIIDRCLELDPANRYRDAGQLEAALKRRERRRRQRPFILGGVAAPIVLLFLITVFAFLMANRTLRRNRSALELQLGESNMISARLAASKVRDHLAERIHVLQQQADDPKFQDLVRQEDKNGIQRYLEKLAARTRSRKIDFVDRWIVMSAPNGRYLANEPPGRTADGRPFVGMNFSWRDYYSGNGDKPKQKKQTHGHIDAPHVSQCYRSVSNLGDLRFGVSVPISDPQKANKIIGVFVTTIKIERFNKWLEEVHIKDGFVELINRQGQIWHNHYDTAPERYRIHELPANRVYGRALNSSFQEETAFDRYRHPVFDTECLGGFAAIDRIDRTNVKWAVLVQHDYEKVTRPVAELKRELLIWSAVLFVLASILLIGVWTVSLRLLSRI